MSVQAGYWFPCDGIVVFDLALAPRKPVSDGMIASLDAFSMFAPAVVDGYEAALIDRLMKQAILIAALQDRADGIVRLQLVVEEAGANDAGNSLSIQWHRKSVSTKHPHVHEGTLLLSADAFFGESVLP